MLVLRVSQPSRGNLTADSSHASSFVGRVVYSLDSFWTVPIWAAASSVYACAQKTNRAINTNSDRTQNSVQLPGLGINVACCVVSRKWAHTSIKFAKKKMYKNNAAYSATVRKLWMNLQPLASSKAAGELSTPRSWEFLRILRLNYAKLVQQNQLMVDRMPWDQNVGLFNCWTSLIELAIEWSSTLCLLD